jgi:predicted PurR-regulated permease PerM
MSVDEWRLTFILFPIHLFMKLFIFLVFAYFMIVEHHHYRIRAINSNNISLMNTSTKITTNQKSHMTSFIILAFCIISSIILCIYAIFHNR